MASLTVDGITVPATVAWDIEDLAVGWMPDTEGLEMSVAAVPGAQAVVTDYEGTRYSGVIVRAHRDDCDAWVRVL